MPHPPPIATLFPYTTLFRSIQIGEKHRPAHRHPRQHSVDLEKAVVGGASAQERGREEAVRIDDRFLENDLARSEEHTSELQSQFHLVCRLLLEKKKQQE